MPEKAGKKKKNVKAGVWEKKRKKATSRILGKFEHKLSLVKDSTEFILKKFSFIITCNEKETDQTFFFFFNASHFYLHEIIMKNSLCNREKKIKLMDLT